MKKTPLHQWHVDNGANMAEFGSYSMPLWYPQGAKNEHISVIENAGLFDTSHMAVVLVKGAGDLPGHQGAGWSGPVSFNPGFQGGIFSGRKSFTFT